MPESMTTKFTNTLHPKVQELAVATRQAVRAHWSSLQEEKNWKRTQTMRALLGGLHRHVGLLAEVQELDGDVLSATSDIRNSIRIVYETCKRYDRTWEDSEAILDAWSACVQWLTRKQNVNQEDAPSVASLRNLFDS